MGLRNFQPFDVKDQNAQYNFTELRDLLEQLNICPLVQGNLLENISLGTADTDVKHKLGRNLVGWIIIKINANETVWESGAVDNKFLPLQASGDVTVTLWVF